MKAAIYNNYGGPEVLKISDVNKPIHKENEILIRVKATAVNSGDVRLRKADPFAVRLFFGLTKPKLTILGSVYSGEVEEAGVQVSRFKKGDLVFGHTNMKFGAYAEYISVDENSSVQIKPSNISHTEAATIPFGGVTALHFIKKAKIELNQNVLIIGASGAVGSAAVQLAKSLGAYVTAVCSGSSAELVKSLGADEVVDYTKENFANKKQSYDLVMDAVNVAKISDCISVLKPKGKLILSAAGFSQMMRGSFTSMFSNKKVIMGVISHSKEDILKLKELIETGKYKPVVEKTYSLAELPQAHVFVEKGHKKGNIAVLV
jgi:2-desacetyl-2-hydroxyethyl bacteriochlorophyllide A dehydrogenase